MRSFRGRVQRKLFKTVGGRRNFCDKAAEYDVLQELRRLQSRAPHSQAVERLQSIRSCGIARARLQDLKEDPEFAELLGEPFPKQRGSSRSSSRKYVLPFDVDQGAFMSYLSHALIGDISDNEFAALPDWLQLRLVRTAQRFNENVPLEDEMALLQFRPRGNLPDGHQLPGNPPDFSRSVYAETAAPIAQAVPESESVDQQASRETQKLAEKLHAAGKTAPIEGSQMEWRLVDPIQVSRQHRGAEKDFERMRKKSESKQPSVPSDQLPLPPRARDNPVPTLVPPPSNAQDMAESMLLDGAVPDDPFYEMAGRMPDASLGKHELPMWDVRGDIPDQQLGQMEFQDEYLPPLRNFRWPKGRCLFCKPDYTQGNRYKLEYTNVALLNEFINMHGMILRREVTGCCAKHQRKLARCVKQARRMALMSHINQFEYPAVAPDVPRAFVRDMTKPGVAKDGSDRHLPPRNLPATFDKENAFPRVYRTPSADGLQSGETPVVAKDPAHAAELMMRGRPVYSFTEHGQANQAKKSGGSPYGEGDYQVRTKGLLNFINPKMHENLQEMRSWTKAQLRAFNRKLEEIQATMLPLCRELYANGYDHLLELPSPVQARLYLLIERCIRSPYWLAPPTLKEFAPELITDPETMRAKHEKDFEADMKRATALRNKYPELEDGSTEAVNSLRQKFKSAEKPFPLDEWQGEIETKKLRMVERADRTLTWDYTLSQVSPAVGQRLRQVFGLPEETGATDEEEPSPLALHRQMHPEFYQQAQDLTDSTEGAEQFALGALLEAGAVENTIGSAGNLDETVGTRGLLAADLSRLPADMEQEMLVDVIEQFGAEGLAAYKRVTQHPNFASILHDIAVAYEEGGHDSALLRIEEHAAKFREEEQRAAAE